MSSQVPMPERAEPARIQSHENSLSAKNSMPLYTLPTRIPRVVVKADLLPALTTTSLLSLLGIPIAFLWSLLAPSMQKQVFPDGRQPSLPMESQHQFDALAIFILISASFGVVSGVLVWLRRRTRGPVVMLGAAVGSAAAALLGIMLSGVFTGFWYSTPTTLAVGDIFIVPPAPVTEWAILFQPMALLFTYGVLAVWNGFGDLGRRLN